MFASRRLSLKSRPLSGWPMVLAALFMFVVVGGSLLGLALLYLAPMLVVCLLTYFALKALYIEARVKGRDLPDTGELPYGFAGHDIRAFSDARGEVWIRAKDIRQLLSLDRSDAWMAGAYPDDYCRAHPGVAAWYMRPDAVRRHWSGSTRIVVNRFIHWMDRELVPLHEKRSAFARVQERAAPPANCRPAFPLPRLLGSLAGYLARHWRGEQRLLHVAVSGAVIALLVAHVLGNQSAPADLVDHYQRYALLLIVELVAGTVACAWWGVGVWRSTRGWLGAERSLIVGVCFAMSGMTALLYAFDRMADRDQQMTLITLGVIAADLGPKPVIRLSADGRRLSLSGDIGFGTTRLVRDTLKRHPGVEGIELAGPGGSATEGFALAALVRDRGLDTYVRSDCASACVLAFAGGRERLVGSSARLGLHRSGVDWRRDDGKPSATDRAMADFLVAQGVTGDFVDRILRTPFHELWVPTIDEVIAGGLGSAPWDMSES